MAWIEKPNTFLTYAESLNNANIIASLMMKAGYKKHFIAGILGNMWKESTLNPKLGELQGTGYGLVQWTPYQKLMIRLSLLGLTDNGDNQVTVLLKELDNVNNGGSPFESWYDARGYTYSSAINSTDLSYTVNAFCWCYERPLESAADIPKRLEYATKYLNDVDWSGGGGGSKVCYGVPIKDTNIDPSSFLPEQLFGYSATRPGNFHSGLDFGDIDHPGNDMIALTDGTITHTGFMDGLRAYVVLSNGIYNIIYQEFSYNVSNIKVKVGDKVKDGDLLAIRDADHLHLSFTKMPFPECLAHSFTDDGTFLNPLDFLGKCFGGDPEPPDPITRKRRTNYTLQCIKGVY